MNAQELADALLKNLTMEYGSTDDCMEHAAVMLRQQADRIAELEKALKQTQYSDEDFNRWHEKQDFKHERVNPTMWTNEHGEISQEEHWAYPTPLYITPQTKPLSDDEICDIESSCQEIWYDSYENGHCGLDALKFARAIEERILGK